MTLKIVVFLAVLALGLWMKFKAVDSLVADEDDDLTDT